MREITYREALREALREEMKRDSSVFLLGEEIAEYGGSYKVTLGLVDEFGHDRVRNTPIAEAGIAGAALGASLVGMRPIVEIMYIDFALIAADQICNQMAKFRYMTAGQVRVPVVVRTQGGGGVGAGSQHSQSWEAFFTHVPGLKVIMPSTPYDAKGLLKSSIRDDNPIVFIETKKLYGIKGDVPEAEYLIPIGKADIKNSGNDLTMIATGRMVQRSLLVAKALAKEGFSIEVIDPRTLIPLDDETIMSSVKKTGKVMIIHEACKTGGFGAEISARIAENCFDYLDAPIKRVASLDSPIPFNPKLENSIIPDERIIWQEALKLLNKKVTDYKGDFTG